MDTSVIMINHCITSHQLAEFEKFLSHVTPDKYNNDVHSIIDAERRKQVVDNRQKFWSVVNTIITYARHSITLKANLACSDFRVARPVVRRAIGRQPTYPFKRTGPQQNSITDDYVTASVHV
jgi:hypothetical protein